MSNPLEPSPVIGGFNVPPMPAYAPGTPAPAPKSKKSLWIILGACAAAVVLLIVIAAAVSGAAESAKRAAVIKDAVEKCGVLNTTGFNLGDKDTTLTIDTKGTKDATGADLMDAGCVLKNLNITDKAMAHMVGTRAIDGRQTETWNGVEAAWTFHPDTGMNMTLSLVDQK